MTGAGVCSAEQKLYSWLLIKVEARSSSERKPHLMRFRAYVILLLLLPLSRGLRAQTYVPWCTAEMLDVRLLLPPESSDGPASARLLVLDLQNRGKDLCTLFDFLVHLPIEDGYSYRFGGGLDHSAAAKTFTNAQSRIAPGDEAHQVIAWSSVPRTTSIMMTVWPQTASRLPSATASQFWMPGISGCSSVERHGSPRYEPGPSFLVRNCPLIGWPATVCTGVMLRSRRRPSHQPGSATSTRFSI